MDWARCWSLVYLTAEAQRGQDLRQDFVTQRVADFQLIERFCGQIRGVRRDFQVDLSEGRTLPVWKHLDADVQTTTTTTTAD